MEIATRKGRVRSARSGREAKLTSVVLPFSAFHPGQIIFFSSVVFSIAGLFKDHISVLISARSVSVDASCNIPIVPTIRVTYSCLKQIIIERKKNEVDAVSQ